jgi:hypothetical protein
VYQLKAGFVPYIDHSYGRTGTLWDGRFKASAVQEEGYLLTCYRYIELNPVRARIVDRPEDYPWSSYRANALGERNPLRSCALVFSWKRPRGKLSCSKFLPI